MNWDGILSHLSQPTFILYYIDSDRMTSHKIKGTIEITENNWIWDVKNLAENDLAFLDKVNPSFALVFKRHLAGADVCEKHISNHVKFLKCLRAVNLS